MLTYTPFCTSTVKGVFTLSLMYPRKIQIIIMEECKEYVKILYCCPNANCNKEYHSKFNLKRHVLYNHVGTKPFTCSICTKKFVSKQNLREHQFTHTGAKPYKCNLCGLKFRQTSLLSLHKRSHESNYQKTLQYAIDIQDNE